MASELRSLFSPIQVGRLRSKTDLSSAHAEAMAEAGGPASGCGGTTKPRARRLRAHDLRRLRAFTPRRPPLAWKQIAITTTPSSGVRAIADAVHDHGCLVFTQITPPRPPCAGRWRGERTSPAPSQIPSVFIGRPAQLEASRLPDSARPSARQRAAAGRRPRRDRNLVGANHLIDQFWSPLFNHRLDDYGGSSRTGCASLLKC